MEDREKIMQRLEALLRLRTDRGATQAEMETAMAMASKIAFKYRINLNEVVPDKEGNVAVGIGMVRRDFRTLNPDCHPMIVSILQRFFGVKCCDSAQGSVSLSVVGIPMDVDFAIYVYAFLRFTFKQLWAYQKELDELSDKHRYSFYNGLWAGLVEKLGEEKAKHEMEASGVNCRAMVLVDEHAAALAKKFLAEFPDAVKIRSRARPIDAKTYASGHEVGKSLNIAKPIGGKDARL